MNFDLLIPQIKIHSKYSLHTTYTHNIIPSNEQKYKKLNQNTTDKRTKKKRDKSTKIKPTQKIKKKHKKSKKLHQTQRINANKIKNKYHTQAARIFSKRQE